MAGRVTLLRYLLFLLITLTLIVKMVDLLFVEGSVNVMVLCLLQFHGVLEFSFNSTKTKCKKIFILKNKLDIEPKRVIFCIALNLPSNLHRC